jgi:hypothetical protein
MAKAATPRVTRAKPKPALAPAVTEARPAGPKFYVNPSYVEIPNGDGVMRAEAGDYVVTTDEGLAVMPPALFAEAYPDLVG